MPQLKDPATKIKDPGAVTKTRHCERGKKKNRLGFMKKEKRFCSSGKQARKGISDTGETWGIDWESSPHPFVDSNILHLCDKLQTGE